jgi:hypothetical protein
MNAPCGKRLASEPPWTDRQAVRPSRPVRATSETHSGAMASAFHGACQRIKTASLR